MEKPKVMVLGTFHMRYTADMFRLDVGDIGLAERQREIRQVVERVKAFKPTKMAFEVVKSENERLNEEYQSYQRGEFELGVDEVYQFGFRIAEELEHDQVYAVDWMESVGNRGIGQVYDWAKEHQPDLYKEIEEKYQKPIREKSGSKSIYELMKEYNQESEIQLGHELNMTIARIGKGEEYVGIDWLRWWYQRNLIIYKNLAELITASDDRAVLLIGSSHIHLVSQFLRESNLVEVVPASLYLT